MDRYHVLSDYAETYICVDPRGPRSVILQTLSGISHQVRVTGSERGVDLLSPLSDIDDKALALDPSRVRLIYDDKDFVDDSCTLTLDEARIPDRSCFVICERFGFEDKLHGGMPGGVVQQHFKAGVDRFPLMAQIQKLERGPLRQKLEKMWTENDRLSRSTAHKSESEKSVIRAKTTALAREAHDLMAGKVGEVVHDARAQLLQIAANLAVADPHEGVRPSSANSSSVATVSRPQTLWTATVAKKVPTPSGDIPEELANNLRQLIPGTEIMFKMKKAPASTTAIFKGLSSTGMVEAEVHIHGKSEKVKQQYYDPSRFVTLEISSAFEGGSETLGGTATPPALTAADVPGLEAVYGIIQSDGAQTWHWHNPNAGGGIPGDELKYDGCTFANVLLDQKYVRWIYLGDE